MESILLTFQSDIGLPEPQTYEMVVKSIRYLLECVHEVTVKYSIATAITSEAKFFDSKMYIFDLLLILGITYCDSIVTFQFVNYNIGLTNIFL
jgi:hypothetical protein